jgi:hypothetical protein
MKIKVINRKQYLSKTKIHKYIKIASYSLGIGSSGLMCYLMYALFLCSVYLILSIYGIKVFFSFFFSFLFLTNSIYKGEQLQSALDWINRKFAWMDISPRDNALKPQTINPYNQYLKEKKEYNNQLEVENLKRLERLKANYVTDQSTIKAEASAPETSV